MNTKINSVRVLRKEQLKTSKREFKARGSLLVRCPECLLGVNDCVCDLIQPHQSEIGVCMLMYHAEYYKPSNTGQLICDAVADNFAFRWYRTELEQSLKDLLDDPTWYPIIVFPHDSVASDRQLQRIPSRESRTGRRPLLIFLDGTWRQAKKMFIKSPYLDKFPVLEVSGIVKGEYKLRESQHDHHLSTVEVAAAIFSQEDEQDMADDLMSLFTTFRNRYQLLKR